MTIEQIEKLFKIEELKDEFYPVVFRPIYKKITGSTVGGLMLAQAIYWSKNKTAKDRGGWFYKPAHEWKKEIGLTRYEHETARRINREKRFIDEKLKARGNGSNQAVLYYRVNFDLVFKAIVSVCGIPSNKIVEIQQSSMLGSITPDRGIPTNIKNQRLPRDYSKEEEGLVKIPPKQGEHAGKSHAPIPAFNKFAKEPKGFATLRKAVSNVK